MNTAYDDIICLQHHTSDHHRRMEVLDRAAQFAPFAALTGYEGALQETGRLTEARIVLSEEMKEELDRRQGILLDRVWERPEVSVTYFLPDSQKAGGKYVTVRGTLRRIDSVKRCVCFADGRSIPIDDVVELESQLFAGRE